MYSVLKARSHYNNKTNPMSMKKNIPFKVKFDKEERKEKFRQFTLNTVNAIPLIIEPLANSRLPAFENCRFTICRDKTINYLKTILAEKMQLSLERGGFFLFVGKKMLHQSQTSLGAIYDKYKDEDGYLYITYDENNPF